MTINVSRQRSKLSTYSIDSNGKYTQK